MTKSKAQITAYLLDRIDTTTQRPCWLWTGHVNARGYGSVVVNGVRLGAHRAVYELLVEPIEAGLVIDHLCRTPACVRPDHLEPVTQGENIRRGLQGELRPPRTPAEPPKPGPKPSPLGSCRKGHSVPRSQPGETVAALDCPTCCRAHYARAAGRIVGKASMEMSKSSALQV